MPTASVLIPSYRRPHRLFQCLEGLAVQDPSPDEVLVVWQGDDTPTRDAAESKVGAVPYPLRVLHQAEPAIVPAENRALDESSGEIILLIDDDAVPRPGWLGRHLAMYDDPTIGAVGGPADDYFADGSPFPRRSREPIGHLSWYGQSHGNMYDQDVSWQSRPPRDVSHLVGYNMSLRRAAFDRFEDALRPYWNSFEMDACLQVAARGFRVVFDFGNLVDHYPSNTAYVAGRHGDLMMKCVNPAYNQAFILGRWSPPHLRPWRYMYLTLVGMPHRPGLLMFPVAVRRYGQLSREWSLYRQVQAATREGWRDGTRARRMARQPRPAASTPAAT